MEDITLHISLAKVIDMVLQEERMKIKHFYAKTLGQPTADYMDTYTHTDSEVLKMFTCPAVN